MTTGWVWDERYMGHDTGRGAGPLPAGDACRDTDRRSETG
jgi:hypothetical protein